MTAMALTITSQDSRSGAAPGLTRFHSDPVSDERRDLQSSDADRQFLGERINPATLAPREIAFAAFRLLPTQFLLLEGDKPVPIGSRALEILMVLLERPGELISKQQLMARVWPNIFVEPANLTVHISALRRTLRDRQNGNRFIINIPGRGYNFVAPVVVAGRIEPDPDGNRAALREHPSAPFAAWSGVATPR
jgi:DNA-binding winged helix-turn-helix (wHTH) protein